ncbi:hypothetical protein Franean1_1567 [Parafrankia sp. EAN1pec]|uniref:hypothetical protein n=1 Tax=Parafrankia sp. (strain EAN1pec) TaxID=298653 RepID=UPI0000540F57|nr:hypothetical protein Franean1_1567 [Frankia sp. EAN1pec]
MTGLAAQGLEHSLAGRFAEAERAYTRLGAAMDSTGAHDGGLLALICTVCVREAAGGLGALRPAVTVAAEHYAAAGPAGPPGRRRALRRPSGGVASRVRDGAAMNRIMIWCRPS